MKSGFSIVGGMGAPPSHDFLFEPPIPPPPIKADSPHEAAPHFKMTPPPLPHPTPLKIKTPFPLLKSKTPFPPLKSKTPFQGIISRKKPKKIGNCD